MQIAYCDTLAIPQQCHNIQLSLCIETPRMAAPVIDISLWQKSTSEIPNATFKRRETGSGKIPPGIPSGSVRVNRCSKTLLTSRSASYWNMVKWKYSYWLSLPSASHLQCKRFCPMKISRTSGFLSKRYYYTQRCRFMGQEVREKRRGFGCVAARVSPLRPRDFHARNSNLYP